MLQADALLSATGISKRFGGLAALSDVSITIRRGEIEYFKENSIAWWMGDENTEPTGHLLSSQVACINHLYFVRQRKDVATDILKNICERIGQAVRVDNGYVEFEVIGKKIT